MKMNMIFFPAAWLLFVFSLVARPRVSSPHCAVAIKLSRIVTGLVSFYCFGAQVSVPTKHSHTITAFLGQQG